MELSELQPQLSLPAHQNYPPRWCNPGSAPSLILGWFPICITNPTFQPDNLDTVGFPGGRVVKKLPASAGAATDTGLIPGLWRSPGEGNGNSLQYSCLENSTDTPLAGYSPWGCRVGHDWALVKNHDINKLLPLLYIWFCQSLLFSRLQRLLSLGKSHSLRPCGFSTGQATLRPHIPPGKKK